MGNYFAYAVSAMALYTGWAFFAKLSTQAIPPEQSVIYTYGCAITVAAGFYLQSETPVLIDPRGIGFSLIAGLCIGLGTVAYYLALDAGSATIVTSISGMYIVGTALLGVVFLGDSLTGLNLVGIAFAVGAVVLLAQ
ncbi:MULTISPECIES: EamA family transporter [Halostella]|uniref:EamA family transporter n=1 Tax=Halostella TaxID=1843185 RepID=UPI001F02CC58|nr:MULTISPECIES: EamA family transporter [Halostella]